MSANSREALFLGLVLRGKRPLGCALWKTSRIETVLRYRIVDLIVRLI